MNSGNLPPPSKWYAKLLLRAYSSNKSRDVNSRVEGKSPLDIPARAILLALLLAIFLALFVGHVFIYGLYAWVDPNRVSLPALREMEEDKQESTLESVKMYALVDFLLPQQWKQKLESGEKDTLAMKRLTKDMVSVFKEPKLTVENILKLSGANGEIEAADMGVLVKGDIERKWGIFPVLNQKSPEEIAEEYLKLYPEYKAQDGETSASTWRRFLTISAIQKVRDDMDGGFGTNHPRRVLLALGGGIQWIVFIVAIWCIVMLMALRIPWARIQTKLAINYRLPWHSNEEALHIWRIFDETKYYGEIERDTAHANKFLAPRLIRETINLKRYDKDGSVNSIIRARVEAYRDSVELGEYEIINFLIWATPTLGFIGTIFGIIAAMENAAAIFSADTAIEQAIALDTVSSALGTAFDTSFIALIWLIPMSFFLARARKAEANFFEELEFEAVEHLPYFFEQHEAKASNG